MAMNEIFLEFHFRRGLFCAKICKICVEDRFSRNRLFSAQGHTLEADWSKDACPKITSTELERSWNFHLDSFIPSKVIQLFLDDRWRDTQMLALLSIYRQAKLFKACFDTFYFTMFALLTLFVKDKNVKTFCCFQKWFVLWACITYGYKIIV